MFYTKVFRTITIRLTNSIIVKLNRQRMTKKNCKFKCCSTFLISNYIPKELCICHQGRLDFKTSYTAKHTITKSSLKR